VGLNRSPDSGTSGPGNVQVQPPAVLRADSLAPLFAALDDPYGPIRASAMRAFARLPLDPDSSRRFTAWIRERLRNIDTADVADQPIPVKEIIGAAAMIEQPEVRAVLHQLVVRGTNDQRRMVAYALAEAGDPAAVPQLLAELSQPQPFERLHAAEVMLQLGAEYPTELLHKRFSAESDAQVRQTLAFIMARQGDAAGIVQMIDTPEGPNDGSYPFLYSLIPETLARGPFSEAVRKEVMESLARQSDVHPDVLALVQRHVGAAEPLVRPHAEPSTEWRPIWPIADAPGLGPDLQEVLAGTNPDRLRTLDVASVALLVDTLLRKVVDEPNDSAANDAVRLVQVRPDYVPAVMSLFGFYTAVTAPEYKGSPMTPMQTGWILARAGLAKVLSDLTEPLMSADPRERLRAADLMELTAIYVGFSDPPFMVGGMGVGHRPTVQAVTDQLIHDSQVRQESEEFLRRPQRAARAEIEAAPAPHPPSAGYYPAPAREYRPAPATRPPKRSVAPRRGPLTSIGAGLGRVIGQMTSRLGRTSATGDGAAAEPPEPPRTTYARVECPSHVVAEKEFALTVGIAPRQTEGVYGDALERPPTSVGPYTLSIQVVVGGFSIRDGESWRVSLVVTADQPYPAADLHLTPDPPGSQVLLRTIKAVYSIDGQAIGAAFRPLVVVSEPGLVDSAPTPPPPAGVDISIPTAKTACDLTVSISYGETDRQLLFTIDSPHPGVARSDPIQVKLDDSPPVVARQLVDKVNLKAKEAGIYALLSGFGKTIADKLPVEFWAALQAVRAAVTDRSPTLLLVSEEPYIPWELAVMKPPLVDEHTPPFLGAQVAVGRWVLGPRVLLPPPAEVRVDRAAVIWGVYDPRYWQPLVDAEAEAAAIEKDYGAVPVSATTTDVLACFKAEPGANLLHFAVHGVYDPVGVQDGLIMTDGQALDPMEVKGSELPAAPFVFLNACQVGSGSRILGDYAGMAAAFLYAGASGVVAPLWSVKDPVAKQIALDFYAKITAGVRPAEVFRTERAAFTEKGGKSPTYLAYQFFGHPSMELVWRRDST